jgi:phage baseplate assembly protein W
MPTYFGYNAPFMGGTQRVLSKQEDQRLIKNDLLQLLLTLPGERIHRPTFGTSLRATVFDQFTDAVLADLRSNIEEAIAKEEQRIDNVQVFLQSDKQNHTLSVSVTGQMSDDSAMDFLLTTTINTGN